MSVKINLNGCRVCLKSKTGTNMHTGDIAEKFQFSTLLQIVKDDGLPEIICKKCLDCLEIAYRFKTQAEASHRLLSSYKQFQQATDADDSNDEHDEDMQNLLDQHPDYEVIECTDNPDASREELVEILSNNIIPVKKIEAAADDNNSQQELEVLMVDSEDAEAGEFEEYYLEEEYDGIMVSEEFSDEQYLDDEFEIGDSLPEDSTSAEKRKKIGKTSWTDANVHNACNVCGKTFSTRTNLTRHMITHEGRKPYICKICGNAFTQNGSLKSHMFIHTGERPFQCTQCNKAFTQSKSLTFHMRRHTGEKPFTCEDCGVKFRQKDGLKRHIIAKHSSQRNRHECDICPKVLLSKSSLRAHRNKHIKQESESFKSDETLDSTA